MHCNLVCCLACLIVAFCPMVEAADSPLRVAVFEADVTPPLGAPLCDAAVPPAKEIVDRLLARGVVLIPGSPGEKPIVLCAFDWVGMGNSGHDEFREGLATAAGTTADRIAVHCLHQHDAPGCDFAADDLLIPVGLSNRLFDVAFARVALQRTRDALAGSLRQPRDVTHVTREDTDLHVAQLGGRLVVTWQRNGRTCILTGPGVDRDTLLELAAWRAMGAIPF
jgi:hypothetical protein